MTQDEAIKDLRMQLIAKDARIQELLEANNRTLEAKRAVVQEMKKLKVALGV